MIKYCQYKQETQKHKISYTTIVLYYDPIQQPTTVDFYISVGLVHTISR